MDKNGTVFNLLDYIKYLANVPDNATLFDSYSSIYFCST